MTGKPMKKRSVRVEMLMVEAAKRVGVELPKVPQFYEELRKLIADELVRNNKVHFTNMLSIEATQRAARKIYNPAKKITTTVPPQLDVRASVRKSFKEFVREMSGDA